MQLLHSLLAVAAIAALCGTCVTALLKSAFHSQCMATGTDSLPDSSIVFPAAAACLVLATLNVTLHFAFSPHRPLTKRRFALLGAMFSSWSSAYFIFLSLQQILFAGIVVHSVVSGQVKGACEYTVTHVADAAALMRHFAVLVMGLSTMCCDADSKFPPMLRRFCYGLLALCCLVDAIGSMIWGNALAVGVDLALGSFNFVLDTQLTSCIFSQVILSLYFVFVSCRSADGRAWSFAPLRFEIKRSDLNPDVSLSHISLLPTHNEPSQQDCVASDTATNFTCLRLRQRLFKFQMRHFATCRVYDIPCVLESDAGSRASISPTVSGLQLVRPLFKIAILHPLHQLAEAHPLCYLGFVCMLLFCSVGSVVLQGERILRGDIGGILSVVLNASVVFGLIGFMSCKSQNIDKFAAKHVATSFRYIYCVVLYSCWIALDAREAILGIRSFWPVASRFIGSLCFFLSLLWDCSTRLSPVLQFLLSVRANFVDDDIILKSHFRAIMYFCRWCGALFLDT
jgi:hypothetical protein